MTSSEQVEVKIITEADPERVIKLYRQAGWWDDSDDPATIPPMIRDSYCFVGAFANDLLIGMGRAISDGASDAYIQDVTVLEEFRGQGIGSKIIKTLTVELQAKKIDWIGLIGEPGTQGLYERHGFKLMTDHLPMKLEN